MKRTLCICNTYSQLLVAMQLAKTLKANEVVDIILTDHSKNAEIISEKLKYQGIFGNVYYYQCREKDNSRTVIEQMKNFFYCTGLFKDGTLKFLNEIYDEFIFYSVTVSSLKVYSKLYNNNPNLIVSRYEEGILSYQNANANEQDFGKKFTYYGLIYDIRKALRKFNLTDSLRAFYCYYPNIYKGVAKSTQIPLINQNDFKQILANVFSISSEQLDYSGKYIYCASIGDFEDETAVGEVKVAKEVAKLVGEDNLIVKLHPRDRSGKFEAAGLTIDDNSSVPWEAIQLNGNFKNATFLTTSSTSVLGINTMLENKVKTCFLYNFCDYNKNISIKNSVDNIKELLKNKEIDFSFCSVPERLEEILQ